MLMNHKFSMPHVRLALRRHLQGLPVYFLGSCFALALDTSVLLLTLRAGMLLNSAAAVGFLSGMAVSYVISVRYAFGDRTVRNRGLEFVSFLLIGLLGLGLTQLMLALLVNRLLLPVVIAKAITSAFVFCFNYSLRKHLLFTRMADSSTRF